MSDFYSPKAKKVTISSIKVKSRLRDVDDAQVSFIAESFSQVGQHTPIICSEDNEGIKLVAGAHRLAAAKILEWEEIEARIYSGMDDNEARLIEIDENLCRRELNPLDRAIFMGERKAVYEKLYPETVNGGDRKSEEYQNAHNAFCSFTDSTIDAVGLGKRTIEKAVRIYKCLSPEMRQEISGTWLANKMGELYALTKYDSEQQEQIVSLLLDKDSGISNVAEAFSYLQGEKSPATNPEIEAYEKLVNLFTRSPASVRERFAEFVSKRMAVEGL